MKKILFLAAIIFAGISAKAQLANAKWKGTLQLNSPVDVIMDFKTDTLEAITFEDNQVLETMHFSVQDSVLSIWKISGQSECGDSEAKYKYDINDGELTLTLISDDCYDRSGVLDGTKWKKQ